MQKFYEFLDKIDQLEDYEVLQMIVGAIVIGIGLSLIVNAIINTQPFEL